jgi:hypothetical protein
MHAITGADRVGAVVGGWPAGDALCKRPRVLHPLANTNFAHRGKWLSGAVTREVIAASIWVLIVAGAEWEHRVDSDWM